MSRVFTKCLLVGLLAGWPIACIPELPGSDGDSGSVLALLSGMMAASGAETTPTLAIALTCGSNCFFSENVLLSGIVGDGAQALQITGGPNQGQFVIMHANNQATTTLYDSLTNATTVGAVLPDPILSNTVNFPVIGGLNDGLIMMTANGGGPQQRTMVFDPATGLTTVGPDLNFGPDVNSSVFTIGTGL